MNRIWHYSATTSTYLSFHWVTPALLAATLVYLALPTIERLTLTDFEIPPSFAWSAGQTIPVNLETIDGFAQVVVGEDKHVITNAQVSQANPQSAAKYIAWLRQLRGGWQIMLHQVTSKQTIALTLTGNASNLRLARQGLIWETVRGNRRQVLYFNGSSIRRLSDHQTTINPDLSHDGTKIVFAQRQKIGDNWKAIEYDLASGQHRVVHTGIDAKYVRYEGEHLAFGLTKPSQSAQVAGTRSKSDATGATVPPPDKARNYTTDDIRSEIASQPMIK